PAPGARLRDSRSRPEVTIMMEILESPANVLAVKVTGKVTVDDYSSVLEPAVERLVADHGELRAAMVIGDEWDSMAPSAAWEDTRCGLAHWRKWKRCAVVTDKDWVRHSITIVGWMMPGEVKVFGED